MQPPVQRIVTLVCHMAKYAPKLSRVIYFLKHTCTHFYEYIALAVEVVQLLPLKWIWQLLHFFLNVEFALVSVSEASFWSIAPSAWKSWQEQHRILQVFNFSVKRVREMLRKRQVLAFFQSSDISPNCHDHSVTVLVFKRPLAPKFSLEAPHEKKSFWTLPSLGGDKLLTDNIHKEL